MSQQLATCPKCLQEVLEDLFISRNGKRNVWCRPCNAAYARERRKQASAGTLVVKKREAFRKLICVECEKEFTTGSPNAVRCIPCGKDIANERCKARFKRNYASGLCHCGRPRLDGFKKCEICHRGGKVRAPRYLQKKREQSVEYRQEMKRAAFERYGLSCACCGESTYEFLSVDHIGGWGKDHRKDNGERYGGLSLYLWLKKNDYPEGFRTLCLNCNCSLGYYGYCPHQRKGTYQDDKIALTGTPDAPTSPHVSR